MDIQPPAASPEVSDVHEDDEHIQNTKYCTKCSKCYITASVVVCAIGIAMLAGGYSAMFDAILHNQIEILPGSISFDIWKDTPVPLTLTFYFFNLTNPEKFLKGAKPELQEVGPYVYQEFHEKVEIGFYLNDSVSFFQQRWWTWDAEASANHSESDSLIVLNPVPVSAAYSVSESEFLLTGLNAAMEAVGETAVRVTTVREILWDGFQDPLLDLIFGLPSNDNISSDIVDTIFDTLPPGLTDYDRFGWFYKRNMSTTYDGHFNMYTGHEDFYKVGSINTWNEMNETEYFTTPCNKVFGSAGEIWPPGQTATSISFYSSDLCMTLTMPYKEKMVDQYGIEGYRYWADNTTFAHPDLVPENHCYCFENKTDKCPPSGLLDAQTCRMGAPAYISFPHFLHADPELFDNITGMKEPDEERDQFLLDMIPELGVPIKVKARMQINMQVLPYPRTGGPLGMIEILKDVPQVVLPLLWFEVDAGLTPELAGQLKPVLFLMRTPTVTIMWSLMIITPVIVIALFLVFVVRRKKSEDERSLVY